MRNSHEKVAVILKTDLNKQKLNMKINRSTQTNRGTKWILTINRDAEAFYSELENTVREVNSIRYLCGQLEKGEQGHVHFQGYIQFYRTTRRSWIMNNLVKCDARVQKGTNDQARNYTRKQRTRVAIWKEAGQFAKGRGSRTDISGLYELAKDTNMSLQAIAEEMPSAYMKYYKAVAHIKTLPALIAPWIREGLKVTVLYGPPDSGKTYWAYKQDQKLYAIPVGKNLWWDNYVGQETVLMDDFSGQMRLVDLLRVLDKYPVLVPIKGSFVYLQCLHIIITTNVPLCDWYDYSKRKDSEEALNRRVTDYLQCRKEGNLYIREPMDKD